MIVYKVVRQLNDKLYSLQCRDLDKVNLTVEYELGVTTLPKLGLLFAFRKDPREYSGGNAFPVYEAIAETGKKSSLDYGCVTWDTPLELFQKFWNGKEIDSYYQQHIPYGTVVCHSIQLTKRLR